MRIRAYAVVCKGGEIHCTDEHSFLFTDRDCAQDERPNADQDECGPHKVTTLSGEWSAPRRPRSRLKFSPRDLAILGGDPSL